MTCCVLFVCRNFVKKKTQQLGNNFVREAEVCLWELKARNSAVQLCAYNVTYYILRDFFVTFQQWCKSKLNVVSKILFVSCLLRFVCCFACFDSRVASAWQSLSLLQVHCVLLLWFTFCHVITRVCVFLVPPFLVSTCDLAFKIKLKQKGDTFFFRSYFNYLTLLLIYAGTATWQIYALSWTALFRGFSSHQQPSRHLNQKYSSFKVYFLYSLWHCASH